MAYHFNEFGNDLLSEIKLMAPDPVLLIGQTGWGKSFLIRALCDMMDRTYVSTNAYPGMDIGLWVGMWRPHSEVGQGTSLVWEDGVLTKAVRDGDVFFLEELSRAPQDATARVFGLLDTTDRYWSLPEAGQGNIPMNPNFWLIATSNPASSDYYTYTLDKALASRFVATYIIDAPIADEHALLLEMVQKDVAGRLFRMAEDSRKDPTVSINTRDLVLCARLIGRGLDPVTAVGRAIAPKYGESGDGVLNIAKEHFRTA